MEAIYRRLGVLLESDDFNIEDFKVSGDEERGYELSIDLAGFESAQEVVEFYNEHIKEKIGQEATVYGSSESAKHRVAGSDSIAMYGEEGELEGEWAVEVNRLLQRYAGTEDAFENAVEHLSAMTLAAVSMAEGGPGGRQDYDLYRRFAREPETTVEEAAEPVVIPVEEEQQRQEEVEEVETPYEEEIEEEPDVSEERRRDMLETVHEDLIDELVSDDVETLDEFYGEILSGTIEEAREDIERMDDPDYERLLEIERRGQNRVGMKEYLEERREESVDEEDDRL